MKLRFFVRFCNRKQEAELLQDFKTHDALQKKGGAMQQEKDKENITNRLIATAMVLLFFLTVSLRYDFYYELNDDMVIADILSGKYTGVPEARTNQLLYPLGWLLSFGYGILPQVPVYPLFLTLCLGGSLWMIYYRSLSLFYKKKTKIGCISLLLVLSLVLMTPRLVLTQYTAVSGILVAASCFWFLTSSTRGQWQQFWKENGLPLFCFLLAFNLRSEMALLCIPMVGICGLISWYEDILKKKEEQRQKYKKSFWKLALKKKFIITYLLFFCVILSSMGIFLIIDTIAYSNKDWKSFREFFDARTKVYDYTRYPSYEKEEAFYEEKGITKIQYQLIENYNFGLDSTITAKTLETIADYNEKGQNSGGTVEKLKNSIKEMLTRPFKAVDTPYNYYILAGYLLMAVLAVLQKRKKEYSVKIFLLIAARSISWFYMCWSERLVGRVIFPLYIIEFLILMAILIKELPDRPLWNIERYYRRGVIGILFPLSVIFIPGMDRELIRQCNLRKDAVEVQEELEIYTKAHPLDYYYLDVYSMVDFTAKMYDRDNEQRNYDFLGGWICNSPLQKKVMESLIKKDKLQEVKLYFSEEEKKQLTISQILLLDHVYLIVRKNRDVAFFEEYYHQYEIPVKLEKVDQIDNGHNPFIVYGLSIVEE